MAIFKLCHIYFSIKEELGEEDINKIFSEYSNLSDKMLQDEQVKLSNQKLQKR